MDYNESYGGTAMEEIQVDAEIKAIARSMITTSHANQLDDATFDSYLKEIEQAVLKKLEMTDSETWLEDWLDKFGHWWVEADFIPLGGVFPKAKEVLSHIYAVLKAREAQAVKEAVGKARKEERESFRKAFISVFLGAGEVWFPYNAPEERLHNDNCTPQV